MKKQEKTVLEGKLDELVERGALVEVYRDRLAREPLVGRVLQHSRHVFVMEKVDELYRHDGLAAARVTDITRVKIGGRELAAGASIAALSSEPLALAEVALLEISSAITILQRRYGQVALFVERLDPGVCFIGEAGALDDDFLVLHQLGTFKSMDRSELLIRLDEITHVAAGGQYERRLVEAFAAGKATPRKAAPTKAARKRGR